MTASQPETSPDDAISVREARTILAAATALRQAADTLAMITTDLSAQLQFAGTCVLLELSRHPVGPQRRAVRPAEHQTMMSTPKKLLPVC